VSGGLYKVPDLYGFWVDPWRVAGICTVQPLAPARKPGDDSSLHQWRVIMSWENVAALTWHFDTKEEAAEFADSLGEHVNRGRGLPPPKDPAGG
jgi:hypothetical protein